MHSTGYLGTLSYQSVTIAFIKSYLLLRWRKKVLRQLGELIIAFIMSYLEPDDFVKTIYLIQVIQVTDWFELKTSYRYICNTFILNPTRLTYTVWQTLILSNTALFSISKRAANAWIWADSMAGSKLDIKEGRIGKDIPLICACRETHYNEFEWLSAWTLRVGSSLWQL